MFVGSGSGVFVWLFVGFGLFGFGFGSVAASVFVVDFAYGPVVLCFVFVLVCRYSDLRVVGFGFGCFVVCVWAAWIHGL